MKLSRLPRAVAPHECDWSTVVGSVGQHRQEQRCQAKLTHQGSFTQGLGRISVAHLSLLDYSLSMHNSTNRDLPRLMNRTRRATVWTTPGQVRGRTVMQYLSVWCFAEKWSMHVCECKRLPRWTDVRMSIRSSLTWLQGTDCVPSAIAPGITGESHSHSLAHGKTWD